MTPQMGWVERASARAKPLQRLKLSAKHTTARRTCSITRPPTPEARAHNTNPAPLADSGTKARQLARQGQGRGERDMRICRDGWIGRRKRTLSPDAWGGEGGARALWAHLLSGCPSGPSRPHQGCSTCESSTGVGLAAGK